MKFSEQELIAIIPELRVFARSKCMNQTDADDLVQMTLERMLEKMHLFRGGKLIAWGITIMKNIIIDQARSTKGKTHVEIEENMIGSHEDDSLRVMDEVNAALQQLTDKCREILVLFGFGHSYEEISHTLNIEKGTVMSRLSRCRQQLMQVMG